MSESVPSMLLRPPADLLDHKYEDYRAFSVTGAVLLAAVASLLWVWDYVVDPRSAAATVAERVLFIPLLLSVAYAFAFVRHRRFVAPFTLLVILACELNFLMILTQLDTGMTYGIGGFMYFLMAGLLLFQGFSLRWSVVYDLSVCVFPHLAALAGIVPGFQHAHYAVLIWPATAMTAVAQVAFAWNYLERYRSQQRLKRSSYTDELSGLDNRRAGTRAIDTELARAARFGRPLSLLVLDIDHFKNINDGHGHDTGDQVIRHVAGICRQAVRRVDRVARWGGEEFVVLLPETGLGGATEVAERIRATVEATPLRLPGGTEVRFTVSVGVASAQPDVDGVATLFARADRAMYRAKRLGRNRVCTQPEPAAGTDGDASIAAPASTADIAEVIAHLDESVGHLPTAAAAPSPAASADPDTVPAGPAAETAERRGT